MNFDINISNKSNVVIFDFNELMSFGNNDDY